SCSCRTVPTPCLARAAVSEARLACEPEDPGREWTCISPISVIRRRHTVGCPASCRARSESSAGYAIALWSVDVTLWCRLDDRLELVEAHGLDEMVVEARRRDADVILPVAATGEGDEEGIVEARLITQPFGDGDAIVRPP